jgi:hypothetical protein
LIKSCWYDDALQKSEFRTQNSEAKELLSFVF